MAILQNCLQGWLVSCLWRHSIIIDPFHGHELLMRERRHQLPGLVIIGPQPRLLLDREVLTSLNIEELVLG